jgi:CheY-like chemotaxis protein
MPSYHPDVVLLDIGLPDMDGWELAPLIRRDNPSTKIFAVTAYQSLEDRQRSKEAGIDLHLGKPLHRAEILGLLAHAAAG